MGHVVPLLTRHCSAGSPSSCPSGLEVEPAGDTINIKRFAGEVEAFNDAALHRFEIDLRKGNSSTSDEFLFVHTFATNWQLGCLEKGDEF